jgi:hypothetical protein
MVMFNSIGYVTLVLGNFSPYPVLHDPLHIQISQVLSLCYAIPTSQLLYRDSGLVCFLLVLPTCYIISPFDVRTHLGSKSIILI